MMENKKQKGRPSKDEKAVRRSHFSIWATADEKQRVNVLIEKSGLSASQFFLTLALDTSIKRPQKKSLPAKTAETILILEKLSGILSLAVLKASSADMLSRQWQQSSQQVRLLSRLIMLFAFEDFELRSMRKTLSDIKDWTGQLYSYLEMVLPQTENKTSVVERTQQLYQASNTLLEKYESYYLKDETPPALLPIWKSSETVHPSAVHEMIRQAADELIKNRKL
jgi:hypothetical protein